MATQLRMFPPVDEMELHVYTRPLHPELFDLVATRQIQHRDSKLDLWLTAAGHVITWHGPNAHIAEAALAGAELPHWGDKVFHRIEGERSAKFEFGQTQYQTSFQVEMLPPHLFVAAQQSIAADSQRRGLMHAFATSHRWSLTPVGAIFVDTVAGGVLFSCFHTFPDECTIVKTQTLIEWK